MIFKYLPLWLLSLVGRWITLSYGNSKENSQLFHFRVNGNKRAILFIHGFGGKAHKTWGNFPSLLAKSKALQSSDIYLLGYASNLTLDLAGIWIADPPIDILANRLITVIQTQLKEYNEIAIIAHSMGGLIVQKALLDDNELDNKISHVILFGTPSNGLDKAKPFGVLKRQIRDMGTGSDFINGLRTAWNNKYSKKIPFVFKSIAGEIDEFVLRTSSLYVFPQEYRYVVAGNHSQIAKPDIEKHHESYDVVYSLLTNDGQKWEFAEQEEFASIVQRHQNDVFEIDPIEFGKVAMALDGLGRREEAIVILKKRIERQKQEHKIETDSIGILAGRIKRKWMQDRKLSDAEEALKLYSEGLSLAKDNPPQAYYLGINKAFMLYAMGTAKNSELLKASNDVLGFCKQAEGEENGNINFWRLATEGEAYLYLKKYKKALKKYHDALDLAKSPWEIESIKQQATWILKDYPDNIVYAFITLFRRIR